MDKEMTTYWVPTPEEQAARTALYKDLEDMRRIKEQPMPHFSGPDGSRSWMDMLDDSEAILNMHTPSREEQGKDDWQSNANVGGAEVRAKVRAVAAGTGLRVPEMKYKARNANGMASKRRAELVKTITQDTYGSDGNPAMNAFLETWHMLSHGTVFEYEGYKTGGCMQEKVVSFDSNTGIVETKKEYVKMDGKPINVIINPQEIFWRTFFVRDIQQEGALIWVQHYTRREIEMEFSKYKNYKFVKDKSESKMIAALNDTTFFSKWAERVQENNDFEVIRRYSKEDDGAGGKLKGYEVWVNGVQMLSSPLLWGEKEKRYPFAKGVAEHFANTNFFVGLPLPIILEGYAGNKNLLLNSLVDKVARGLDPLKLVGLMNRDLLDVESEIHSSDSTIYVPDITQVKFMDHPQVNNGEMTLLGMLNQGMQLVSIDNLQQGVNQGGSKTARAAVIADRRAQELKGGIYLALESLWFQKATIRTQVVLTHYIKDKAAADTINGGIISIRDYSFGDGTRGTLDIHIAKTKAKLLSQNEIEAREEAMRRQGENYKLVSMMADYVDDWQYDLEIVPQSFHDSLQAAKEEDVLGEIEQVAALFPAFFAANQDKYLSMVLGIRGRTTNEYAPPLRAQAAPVDEGGAPVGGKPAAPAEEEMSLEEMLAGMQA